MRRPMPSAASSISHTARGRRSRLRACALLPLLALAAPAFASDIIPPKVYTTTPGGINVADGSFVYSVTDLSIGPMTFERFLVSGTKKPDDPLMGQNMSHNFDIFVAPNLKTTGSYRPIVHIGSTASGVYARSSTATIATANSIDARDGFLEMSGSNYVYTDKTGTIYTFSAAIPAAGVPNGSQRVTQITFPDGRIQTFSYNGSNQLKLVSDSSGYAIVLDYNAAGYVSAACGFDTSQAYVTASTTCAGAALKTSYAYDGNGLMTSATDVLGQTTFYDGNIPGGLPCVRPPGYSTCKISNQISFAKVTSQTMADGAVWHIASSSDPDSINDPDTMVGPGSADGSVTDPDNKTMSFQFTKSTPYSVTDAHGYTTQYRFYGGKQFDDTSGLPDDEGKLLQEVDLPEGGKYLAEYNGPLLGVTKETLVPKPGSTLANQVKTLTYSSTGCSAPATRQNCGKPLSIVDPNGKETDFTYYDFGAVKTEWSPAPTAGAARPLKVYNYTQLYAWVKNASGTLVQASTPVWKLTSEVGCQSAPGASSPVCDAGSTQITTTYQYGGTGTADTLLLRGKVVDAGGLNLRTCYGYDAQGNKIWETSPRAGLPNCS
jgi:YD repeat-containing protein